MRDLVASLALTLYPIVAICLFAIKPFSTAILWTVMLAQLLLPVGPFIKFEMIPQFDKISIPSICLFLACVGRWKLPSPRELGWAGIFGLLFLFGPIVTSNFNAESLRFGPRFIPGVGLYDAVSALILSVVTLAPYFVGRAILRQEKDNAEIFRILILSMIVYSIPLLIEVRLSPQFHYWVYGSYPSDFSQSIRDGGFRPMVFMGHGLILAHFVLIAFLAAAGLWRMRISVIRFLPRAVNNYRMVAGYLGVILMVFCSSLGTSIYGLLLSPLILLTSARMQMRVAVTLAVLGLLYPTLRYLDVVPTQALVSMANSVSEERGQSLGFRFDNEDVLLKHAIEKPFFGWGRFGRNRVYDEQTGQDLTITDGEWIIVLGQFGIIGFIAEFGLLCLPVFRAAAALRYARSQREAFFLSVMAIIVGVSVFDLLPNAGLVPWTWLMAGALLGAAEQLLARDAAKKLSPVHSDYAHIQRPVIKEGIGPLST